MTIGFDPESLSAAIRPGDNFYEYVTREWRNRNPIPDDYSRYGTWEILNNTNQERVRQIAENDTGKIGLLYKIAMDSEKLNADKTTPVAPYLAEIDELRSPADLPGYLGRMFRFTSAFWGDGVALDEKDSEHFLYNIVQGGIGLPRDYFIDTDEKSKTIREKYKQYITAQMKNYNIQADTDKLYALEERMAKSFYPKEKLRDPHANYHKMSIAEIKEKFPSFNWDEFLSARGAGAAEYINIGQPEAIAESIAIINDTDFALIKTYLKYRIIGASESLLDDATYDIAFDFYSRTMRGQKEQKPRWKRAVMLIDDSLGEEIGRLYTEKYFSPAAKKRMQELVKNLQRAFAARIQESDWMSGPTKTQALEKLNGFTAKIGYPDKWRNYDKLVIKNDSLWENMVRVSEFSDDFWLQKIGKENDPTLWYMNAHEVNAYYDPSTNEICFPAGILQPPFFDMDADDAFNYGAIGAIIGHEMTHGFDDSGRHFDTNGNMRDWWQPSDADAFSQRANVMKEFFDKIAITPDIHANGEFTLGENLADYGGVTIAYAAYKNYGVPSDSVNGITSDMRFFIAYAGAWSQNIRPDEAIRLTKTDEHSIGENRVNGILVHIPGWYDAFNITPADDMYIAPNERVTLW